MNSSLMAKPLTMAAIKANQRQRRTADGASDQACH
jgi:hypothetical protein